MYTIDNWMAPSVNTASVRDLYPETQSLSLPEQGGSGLDWTMLSGGFSQADAGGVGVPTSPDVTGANASLGPDASTATRGTPPPSGAWHAKPLTWVIVLMIFTAAILFTAHKTNKEDEFKTIKASGYNIAFVGLVAMVFFLVFKSLVGVSGLRKTGFGTAVMAA